MSSISLCMIVKDEEDVIERCLNSVKDLVDEIVIIDTGSTDSTKDIVKKFTDNIYDFKWIDDFSKARNYSFEKATKEYIMWLDADDIILDDDRTCFKQLKDNLSSEIDMVIMKYNVAFDNDGKPTYIYNRERLMKRSRGYKWIGEIHEVIPQSGNLTFSNISISHKKVRSIDPKRNLRIFEKMIQDGKIFDSRQEYYYARELYFNGMYEEAIDKLSSFISSGKGWVENIINACLDLSSCYCNINMFEKALESLFKSFQFDEPRAEVCCEIGAHFIKKEEFRIAKYWYEIALTRKLDDKSGGFKLLDCYGYVPYIQLCVCHDRLGDKNLAKVYNEMASKVKPNDAAVLYNQRYFASLEDK